MPNANQRFSRIVILTGAGISAESGIATFRDADGLWAKHDINEVATPEAYARNPAKGVFTITGAGMSCRPSRMRRIWRWHSWSASC